METNAGQDRERFLDAVRTVAVVRVIVWHAFGAAAITYVLSAVPAMFFVTGSLLARSIDRHGGLPTIADRLRRMLIPLALFAAVAFTVMTIADHASHSNATAVPRHALAFWVFPIVDPQGSAWEAGWLSSPLWYLRALLWLVLAAPLLLRVVRTAPFATFAVLLGIVFSLDLAGRHPEWPLQTTRVPWLVGDFALYAIFVGLGFCHRDGRLTAVSRRAWAAVAATTAVAAAAWALTQPVPNGVVNNSHPLHLLVGLSWLAVAFAFRPLIERTAARKPVASLVTAMNARSMSVYLWHSSAIIVGYQLLWRLPVKLPPGLFSALLVLLTIVGTVTLVTAFGWIEDLAAQRRSLLWPKPMARHPRLFGTATLAGVGVFALAGITGATFAPLSAAQQASAAALPAPSRQPETPTISAPSSTTGAAKMLLSAQTLSLDTDDAIASVVDAWLVDQGISGAQLAIIIDGNLVHAAAYGTTEAGDALRVNDTVDVWSITKTYTAWLVYQFVQSGQLQLDTPLPQLRAVPLLDTSNFTVRELLTHATGLAPYRDTLAYLANPSGIVTPSDALDAVVEESLRFTPGTRHEYSSSNYLVLGLLLEQVSGRSFDQLLQQMVFSPLELHDTALAPSSPGNPNFSTGGVSTTIVELASWAQAYLADNYGLDATSVAAMNTIDGVSAIGGGTIGYCPCTTDAKSGVVFDATGYNGSTTRIQYSSSDGTVIALNLTQTIWEPTSRYGDVNDLLLAIRSVLAARAFEG